MRISDLAEHAQVFRLIQIAWWSSRDILVANGQNPPERNEEELPLGLGRSQKGSEATLTTLMGLM